MGPITRKVQTLTNYSGTSKCRPSAVHYPTTTLEIQTIIRQARTANRRIRTVGCIDGGSSVGSSNQSRTRGSLSMCDDGDIIICMQNYNKIVNLDVQNRTITAQAGCTVDDMIPSLRREGLALPNIIPDDADYALRRQQGIGDLTAVGTTSHGSSDGRGGRNGGRSDYSFGDLVVSYKICDLTDHATVHTIRADDDDNDDSSFHAFGVHLGLLAVVLEVTLTLRRSYRVRWNVRDVGNVSDLTLDRMRQRRRDYDDGDAHGIAYTYFPSTGQVVEIIRTYADDDDDDDTAAGKRPDVQADFTNTLRKGNSTLLRKCCPFCVEPYSDVQKRALLSLSGSTNEWSTALSLGDLWGGNRPEMDHRMEYACPFDKALEALKLIRDVLDEKARKIPSIVCLRFCRGSKSLLAPHYSSSSTDLFVYIEVQLQTRNLNPRIPLVMQNELAKLRCRAHWGKENSTTHDLIASCQLWPVSNVNNFLDVKSQYDPDDVLGNIYTDRIFSRGKPGAITIVENGNVHTVVSVDDEEQEANPIAIMALPPHGTHKEGQVISVEDGVVASSINMAEC